jgi:hypothetical protein
VDLDTIGTGLDRASGGGGEVRVVVAMSSRVMARGSGIGTKPRAVNMFTPGRHGGRRDRLRPCGVLAGWDMRPTCMSWMKRCPPAS